MGKRFNPPKAKGGKHIAAPAITVEESPQKQHPAFCFQHLRKSYCLSKCEQEEKIAFIERLHTLSQMTWADIHHAPRKGLGTEIISQDSIKGDGIPSHLTPDVNLIAFRFQGNKPMVGYRIGRIFHVLWLDRDFSLYDHGS